MKKEIKNPEEQKNMETAAPDLAEEELDVAQIKKSLISRGALCGLVIVVLIIATFAWFAGTGGFGDANGFSMGAFTGDGISFELYELTKTSAVDHEVDSEEVVSFNGEEWTWVQVTDISLTVPNEVHRYLIRCGGSASRISFSDMTFSYASEGALHTEGIVDFVYVLPVTNVSTAFAGYAGIAADSALPAQNRTYWALADSTDHVAWEMTTSANLEGYVFDAYLHKDTCNYFSGAAIEAQLTIQ